MSPVPSAQKSERFVGLVYVTTASSATGVCVPAEASSLAAVGQRSGGRAAEQRTERERAAPGSARESTRQPPAQRRAHCEHQVSRREHDAAPIGPRARVRDHPIHGRARRPQAVHLVQLGDQLDLDTRDRKGLGRDLDREQRRDRQQCPYAHGGAHRRAGLSRAVDQRVGYLIRATAGELLAQGRQVTYRQPRRHGQHFVRHALPKGAHAIAATLSLSAQNARQRRHQSTGSLLRRLAAHDLADDRGDVAATLR